ncbi:dTDP-4-dehydrorhamnose 3,5-epimerase-like enzyme [Clostridium saccharobutylicum]|nr:dTDP-4-dehydrorhamnose 3,5-epimerase-like enzyme [Clostridium saccharobutylicum]
MVFLVLSDEAIFNYKCTDFYYPKYESGVKWNDADINVEWPLDQIKNIILSEKDKKHPNLKELDLSEFPQFNVCEREGNQ